MSLDNKHVQLIDPRDVEVLEMVAGLTERATQPIQIPLGNVLALPADSAELEQQHELLSRIGDAYTRIASALGLVASVGAQENTGNETVASTEAAVLNTDSIDSDTPEAVTPPTIEEVSGSPENKQSLDFSELEIPLLLDDGFELLPTEAAMYSYLLKNGPTRAEVLRKEVPEIAALTGDQYIEFRTSLKKAEDRVTGYFARLDFDSSWVVEGKTRGRTYDISLNPKANDPQEPKLFTAQEIVDIASSAEEVVVEVEPQTAFFSDIQLTAREINLLGAIIDSVNLSQPFSRKAISFEGIEFKSDSARNQAFSTFTKKLIESGYLSAEGVKGGRKYTATPKLTSVVQPAQVQDEEALVKNDVVELASEVLSSGLTVSRPVINRRQQPTEKIPDRTAPKPIDTRKAGEFADRVQTWVKRTVEATGANEIKKSVLRKLIADEIGISSKEAGIAISNLVGTERLHKGVAIKGSAVVSLVKVERQDVELPQNGSHQRRETKTWNSDLIDLAARVMDYVDAERHLAAGKKTQDIIREFMSDEYSEMDVKITLRELCSQGLLLFKKDSRTSRSPHSKNLRIPKHTVKDKAARNFWRNNRDDAIQSLVNSAESLVSS